MPRSLFSRASPELKARLEANETARLTNSFDWAATPLGPLAGWPEALLAAVRLIMVSQVPMAIIAGRDHGTLVYNQGYAQFAGDRHPRIFGAPIMQAWPEIAEFNRISMDRGFAGESWFVSDQELMLNRWGETRAAYLDLNCSPILDEDGTTIAMLAVVMETTPRVLTERALAESREKLDLALHAAAMVGVWDWDIVNDRVTGDERFAGLIGISDEDSRIGVSINRVLSVVHPQERDHLRAEIEAAIRADGDARIEARLLKPEGDPIWVVAAGRVQMSPERMPLRFRGVVVDISQQKRAAQALAESEAMFRTLADTMPQMVWSARHDGYNDYYNARWYEFTGMQAGTSFGHEWKTALHPNDAVNAEKKWRYSLQTGEPYRVEYRLRHHSGEYRWVLGQALPIRDEYQRIMRWFGTCTDIHESRLVAEEREVVAQELSHRIKNIFSVITGLIALSARNYPGSQDFAAQLRERIVALGRAHDFVRPHSRGSAGKAAARSLHALIDELLIPYRQDGASRVTFLGDDAPIDDGTATPLALLFHELATNAAKYGSLSREGGRVVIATNTEGAAYRIIWREQGGPSVGGEPQGNGFGSRLIGLSVEGQLGGKLDRRWDSEGLVVEIELPVKVLSRSGTLQVRRSEPPQTV